MNTWRISSNKLSLSIALSLLATGCGITADSRNPLAPPESIAWREIATADDRTRLRGWRTAWVEGLKSAQAAGNGPAIAREGILLNPDAAAQWQSPPAGDYQCRVLKLGSKGGSGLAYVAYPAFNCRIRSEGSLISFAKLTGSQRPLGLFLPDSTRRMIFLGTLQLGDERLALEYGRDRERDLIGVVEYLPDGRWRLALPYPHFESLIDVIELVPRR